MSEYNSVNDEIRAQSKKLKDMPLRKKIGYYIYYYKWIALAVIASVLMIFFIIKSIVSHLAPTYVTGIFMNCNTSSTNATQMAQAFSDYYSIDTNKYSIDLDYSLGYDIEDPTDSLSVYSPAKMVGYSEGHNGDFILCDADTFDFFAQSGYFADLSEVFTNEQLSPYDDSFYSFDSGDGRGSIPIAIRIENTDILHSMSCYPNVNDIYFAVFHNSKHKDRALEFLNFIETSK